MISRIEGSLIDIESGRAHLKCGALVYEVLIPAADHGRLAICVGETVELHTLHILEGNSQGSSFRPRLIGFASASDRAFFELFTTVKGIGARKALRIMEIPVGKIARAVYDHDVGLLTSLPEVGKRTAEAIIVELKEKVESFLEDGDATGGAPHPNGNDDARRPAEPPPTGWAPSQPSRRRPLRCFSSWVNRETSRRIS